MDKEQSSCNSSEILLSEVSEKNIHPGRTDSLFIHSPGLVNLKQLVLESVGPLLPIQHRRMVFFICKKLQRWADDDIALSACPSFRFGVVLTRRADKEMKYY